MKVLCLDSSVNNVGWCVFDGTELKRHALKGGVINKAFALNAKMKAWTWGTFMLEGSSKSMRFLDLVQQIIAVIGNDFDYLITEQPAFYSSEKGQVAARMNYTIDLASCNYFVAGWFHMTHREHFPITAITWKGSVSKAVTTKKFLRTFPKIRLNKITEHAIDATMLLHYWLSTFAVNSPLVERRISPELIRVLL